MRAAFVIFLCAVSGFYQSTGDTLSLRMAGFEPAIKSGIKPTDGIDLIDLFRLAHANEILTYTPEAPRAPQCRMDKVTVTFKAPA